jgi:uncharacterized protein
METLTFRVPPLPAPLQRRHFAERLGLEVPERVERRGGWAHLFETMIRRAEPDGAPRLLILDDAHHLAEARANYFEPLIDALANSIEERRTLHVIFVGAEAGLPDTAPLADLAGPVVRLDPLPFRAALPLLPGAKARDRLRAYGVFGGIPTVLETLDPTVTVGTNIRRLLAEPEGGGRDILARLIERDVQAPPRYVAVLSSLVAGEAEWSSIATSVPDLKTSGQLAPYLRRLQQLGLIEARRSLDAAAGSRRRRYRITDPFIAFWYRFLFPLRFAPAYPDPAAYYAEVVKPALSGHLDTTFPQICRQYMERDAMETLGANARESGSLWGAGYDIPVAGTLTSGAAYVGACAWEGVKRQAPTLSSLDDQLGAARYKFGRERHMRLVFAGRPVSGRLRREIARRDDALLIGPGSLAGTAPTRPDSSHTSRSSR